MLDVSSLRFETTDSGKWAWLKGDGVTITLTGSTIIVRFFDGDDESEAIYINPRKYEGFFDTEFATVAVKGIRLPVPVWSPPNPKCARFNNETGGQE